MLITFLLLLLGLALLLKGGDWLVDGASTLARKYRVSELAIGLTIVAFGTSAPELVVNVLASAGGHADIAFGNVIGSNNFNLFLILGVSSTIKPMPFSTVFNIDITILLAGTVFLFIAMFTGGKKKLDRWEATLLVTFFVGYMTYLTME